MSSPMGDVDHTHGRNGALPVVVVLYESVRLKGSAF